MVIIGSLWQYYRDEPALNDTGAIDDFPGNSASLKFKQDIIGKIIIGGTKDVEVMVPLKYLSNFWRTLQILLINCKNNLILTWSTNCVIPEVANQATAFVITDTKLYVLVETLSIQDDAKLLQQLKSGFKRTINWNKYQSNVSIERPRQYLDFLVDPIFQGINRLFVLSFENKDHRTSHSRYFLPKEEIKDYNVMIGGQNFFDQPLKNDLHMIYDNI